jgi:DNA-binding NarL/FixJ family response regulator
VSGGGKLRILVVEDHFITREGLRSLIGGEPDMEVVGEARDGAEALGLYRTLRPDVVLMDLRLPRLDGLQSTEALLRDDPRACVLIVSSYDTDEDVGRAHDAGARGYILKEAEGDELLRAIRTVHGGQRYLPPVIAARLEARRDEQRLSVRDRQILDYIHQGHTNGEIAELLHLAPNTVRVYVSALLGKLGARNRTEALARAVAKGLLKP